MKKIVFSLLLLVSFNSYSDKMVLMYPCGHPNEIIEFDDMSSLEGYEDRISRFKECTEETLLKHKQALIVHNDSIKNIMNDWSKVKNYFQKNGQL